MAKLKDGFYKLTAEAIGNNSYMLLAGGGSKALSDFATASGVVTALGTNGNYVTWTKNGIANNLTVPYATTAGSASKWTTARTLTIGNKGQSVNGTANVTWDLHDILLSSTQIGVSTSWLIYTPGVYYVASSSAFTGDGNPESANGGLTPYRYGQLIVSRATTGGVAQFYISHTDSSDATRGIKYRTGWNSTYQATWASILDSSNYTLYVNTTNFPGLNKTGTVTSITLTAGSGISITNSGTAITTSGTRTITNSGVRSTTINGNYLRVNTNGTNADLTIPYATSAGNADTVDSKHSSDFEAYKCTVIDTTGLNENTWYPVTFEIGCSLQTRIRVEGRTSTTGSWNTRSNKTMAVLLDYVVQGSNWGWISPTRIVYDFELGAGAGGTNCVAGLGLLTNSSTEYVYVRGGAKYNFYISRFITPVLRTASYTVSSQTIAPTTTSPTAITINNALKSDLTWSNVSGKPTFASVATSGSYTDLSNKPTIGNGTITINLAGKKVGSFSLNSTSNTTIDLTDVNTWRGITNSTSTTSSDISASATAVKSAYDKAVAAYNLANGKTANTGTVTSVTITQGTGITVSNSGTAITTSGTRTITLNSASSSAIGGVQLGYTASGANIPLQTSSNKGYVALTKAAVVAALGYTPPTSDTNTDTKVTQTNTTANSTYRVLLSGNANDTTETTTARKSAKLLFNTSSGKMDLSGLLLINTSITDHANPTAQCLVINSPAAASGTTLSLKNAPGIGFHIGNTSWASLVFGPSGFNFINDSATAYQLVNASTIKCIANSKYISINPANSSYIHYTTDATIGHYFNTTVHVNGAVAPYGNNSFTSGTVSYRWSNVYAVNGNFSGRITSSVATGTAPFNITSTTKNEKLNADMLDGYHIVVCNSSTYLSSSKDSNTIYFVY